ncbi:MAG: hypothetical protein ABL958_00550 [Bdellovibrionia bacterium]
MIGSAPAFAERAGPTTLNDRALVKIPREVSHCGFLSQIARAQVGSYMLWVAEEKIKPPSRTPMVTS